MTLTSQLTTARKIVGAFTPKGHGYSNLAEQSLNLPGYVRPSRATHPSQTLPAKMGWQADRQESLSFSKGDRQ